MRKWWMIIGGIVGIGIVFLVLLIGFFYFLVISGAIFSFSPNPSMPEITYGEFPIRVIYEVDGEQREKADVIICEFDGIVNLGSGGKRRKWKSHLKSGKSRMVLLNRPTEEKTIEISMSYGLPNYYMGDFEQSREEYERVMADDRYLGYIQWEDGVQTGRSITKEEVWEKYKLKIVDVQYSQPIQNTFKQL